MGNGHPISAVVTTKEIADTFNNGMEYFNSFGGNPVSCAVGRAVLQVIEEEKLQEKAFRVGAYLMDQLNDLKQRHNKFLVMFGDVVYFFGIELIKDPEKLTPASDEAEKIANDMKDHGILISTDGPEK
ncbi:MAG: hypothetical protein CM1200mP10_07280 [Candidatus Neomarinimicrobiota bacterium]|nr:MAG: hypothetical protein CM1200mP10_07280 [Candidatus Neomarinimicrobiota bacterium]